MRASGRLALGVALVVVTCALAKAQEPRPGTIRGRVMDKEFDVPIAGAQILVVENGRKTTTNPEGTYVLENLPAGKYTLAFSKDGYLRQVRADVLVQSGTLTEVSVTLAGDFTDLEEVVVQDILKFEAGSEASLLNLRLESAALLDSVGSDLMSRAGASDAASALRLVAGASVADGKSAVIRGLPDRYVSSQINGVRLPTADENKRAVELDQFPAAVVESIQVSKTFTPDQQSDASGGAVDLRLKGIPDEPFFLQWRGQGSRNSQVTGRRDFQTYDGGGLNHWGRDHGRLVQRDRLDQSWTGAVGTREGEAPDDFKWSAATGGKQSLGDGFKLGGLASFFYERDSSFHDHARDDSYWVESPGAKMTPKQYQGSVGQGEFKTSLLDVQRSSQSVQWGWLGGLGVESEHHSVGFSLLYTRTAEDTATLAEDTRGKEYYFPGYDPKNPQSPGHEYPDAAPYVRLETLEYTERTTGTLQLHGKHEFPIMAPGFLKNPELDWTLSHNEASLYQPDKRQFGSFWVPGRQIGPFRIPPEHRPYKPSANFTLGNVQRIFKDIQENSDQYSTNGKLPFEQWNGRRGYVKLGVFGDRVHRRFDQETFSNFNDNTSYEGEWEERWSRAFPAENHPISESLFDVDYEGRQRIRAWYAMLDLPLTSWLQVIGGARMEATSLSIENQPEANATWFPPGSVTQTTLRPGDADVSYRQDDVLPSLALVAKPVERLTLRASFNETVARQTFKELTPILQQEYLGGPIFIGNPNLRMSAIQNYDLRADYTPYDGGLFSVSWFKKDIRNPIEYVQRVATSFDYTTAVNYPSGRLDGFELETRHSLGRFWEPLEGISVGANATFLDAKVRLSQEESAGFELPNIRAPMSSRDMTNAPRHLYNFYVTYDVPSFGTKLGAFYTVQGDTLVAGAGQSNGNYVPNVYAKGYDTLNLSLSQRLCRYVNVSLGAKNVTNPHIDEVYRSSYIGDDVLKSSFTRGVEITFGIGGEVKF